MRFIQTLIERRKRKIQARNDLCNSLISGIDNALNDAKSIFPDPQEFIAPSESTAWHNRSSDILEAVTLQNVKGLKKASQYPILCSKKEELYDLSTRLPELIAKHNDHAASLKIRAAYFLIGTVEGHSLDPQQMDCIIREPHNHLVVAGAGTGKTTTIVGKVKYLLKSGKCLPQDVLVLSFTNASATEMAERISNETEQNIEVSTFHKLGLNIISQVNGFVPKITQLNLRKFIKEQLSINMRSPEYLNFLSAYILYSRIPAKSEFDFTSKAEYDEYIRLNPPTTINNEVVKSYGEMDIANFLIQHGVRYIYENPYEHDTRTKDYSQYHPDFYLPDHNIYIEYFGINRDGKVPAYFKSSGGMTASEAYRKSMDWKRATHREHKTVMIECYAWEKSEGILLDALKEKLENASVSLTPRSPDELWSQVSENDDSFLDGIIELFETLINLIKSNRYTIDTVRKLIAEHTNSQANNIVLSLVEPIFNAYCQYLLASKEIDFNDMINLASEYVRLGKYENPYKYVIVDEYQDISKARFILLQNLRKSKDFDLFCVGDDWQSIYRFAGSDVGFILDFSGYWGESEMSRIETTYRFSQRLIEISGNFIMKNPMQIEKRLIGKSESAGFPLGEISGYTDKYAVKFMHKKLSDLPRGSSVYFIGRYSFDVDILDESGLFDCKYNNVTGLIDVKSKLHPYLKMTFLTAHRSKGLQADYVFIINNKRSKIGFPSKIQDAPILDLLLDNSDTYPYAEERRLFYVAMTRAKKKVFLLTVSGSESEFALELKNEYESRLKKERFECPVCGGYLIKRSGPYGEFFGCSNYHSKGCKYKRNI